MSDWIVADLRRMASEAEARGSTLVIGDEVWARLDREQRMLVLAAGVEVELWSPAPTQAEPPHSSE